MNHLRIKERNTSIELFRLICMFLIVLGHLVGNGLSQFDFYYKYQITSMTILSFCIVGVNCFILISGYFQIKSPISILNIYFISTFYSVLLYLLNAYFIGDFETMKLIKSLFSISKGGLWFILCYSEFLLLSPIINSALHKSNNKILILYCIVLSILNLYFGYFMQGNINPNGFNVMHFIYMYTIGYTLAHFKLNIKPIYLLNLYIVCSIILSGFAITIYNFKPSLYHKYIFVYNNPLIILSSVSLFLFFIKLPMKNISKINYLAIGSLAIYLIQGNIYIKKYIYEYVSSLYINNEFVLFLYLFVLSIIIVFLCALFDILIRDKIFSCLKIDSLIKKAHKVYKDKLNVNL